MQADLRLCWSHNHIVGNLRHWLIFGQSIHLHPLGVLMLAAQALASLCTCAGSPSLLLNAHMYET